jgi:hypothetical protein
MDLISKARPCIFAALSVLSTGFSASAIAGPQWCTGTIDSVWINYTGDVFIRPSWRLGDHVRVCNVNDQTTGPNGLTVAPTVCLSWVSLLRSAASTAKSTVTHYSEAPSCETIPTYANAPFPFYIMLNK